MGKVIFSKTLVITVRKLCTTVAADDVLAKTAQSDLLPHFYLLVLHFLPENLCILYSNTNRPSLRAELRANVESQQQQHKHIQYSNMFCFCYLQMKCHELRSEIAIKRLTLFFALSDKIQLKWIFLIGCF